VPIEAQARGLEYLDATCPLVSKVHRQAERLVRDGRHIIFIGHKGHPEVIGTLGQVPHGTMSLIETEADAWAFAPIDPENLAFLTQTTLSVDDTAAIVATLQQRFPTIQAPRGEDICYATSNRQAAVKAIAHACDKMLVIGAPNSSNSLRLVEVAEREGAPARLIQRATEIDFDWLAGTRTLGITAGASAPEVLVREVVARLAERYEVVEQEVETARESVAFKLPKGLEAAARG
jgi:4-hydroxy-3-methylbut-2-enyl diphosphate reductase